VTDYAALHPDDFRQAARGWLEANFPPSLRGLRAPLSGKEDTPGPVEDHADWKQRMADIGWGAPGWPQAYGGGGLNAAQAEILGEEMARAGAFNPIGGLGLMMLGPTLLEYGNEAQKREHLPKIARGEMLWCQGFSEPGAGSDLASLRTRCDDKGDHWLVNGQKIWTSYAHLADWCFCLVRTSTERKQGGISFLLIDMKTPGIAARPITLINGGSHFCETFFTDVAVPKENLVGEVDKGWGIAKRLLQFERNGLSALRGSDTGGVDLPELARRYCGSDGAGRIADADLRVRLTDHLMTDHAYRLTLARRAREAESDVVPTTPVSVLKNIGAIVGQQRSEMSMEVLGYAGLGWSGDEFSEEERAITDLWLFSKCYSIYGGSHEVQNNITALRELNLPTG
jgi:acyl-CoA dehydrogenase